MGRRLDEVSGRRKIESARLALRPQARRRNRARLRPPRRWPRRAEARPSAHNATPIAPAHSARFCAALGPIDRRTKRGFHRLPRDRARTQQLGPAAETGDDRRFEAMAAWPSVEDPVDPAVEIGDDMSGGRRAYGAGSVGGGRRERDASRLDQRARRFVRRRANRHRVKAGAREQADPSGRARRAGPE